MDESEGKRPADGRLKEIDTRVRGPVRRAGALLAASGALWPVQALAVAWSVHLWAQGDASMSLLAWLAAGFVLAGLLRAALESAGGRLLFDAADRVIGEERARLINRESRRTGTGTSSAALAALVAEKLPHLGPYLTRYRPARVRVMVVPLLFFVLTFSVSWVAGLVLLIAGPLIPLFMAVVGMAAKEASRRQMAEIGDMNSLLIDRLAALADIRLLDAEDRSEAAFAERAESLRARTMAVLRVAFLSSTVLELFAALGVAMVAVYTGFSLLGEITIGHWATPLTLGEGVFILLLAPEFFQPLRDLAAAWHDRAAAQAVAEELAELEAEEAEDVLGTGGQAEPLPGPAHVRLRGAAVRRGGARVVLPDLDLSVGQAVVLSGPSGSGKSSCLAAVAGLQPLVSGSLTVAGQPLTEANADAWRARLAWVPQAVHVPDVTLRDFLTVRGGENRIAEALRAAGAEGFVAALPDGLETRLGETGAGVSGGEARRLLLARAMLARADVVLADEPTADLDADTARVVISALRRMAEEGAAVLVASHDPAVVAAMDATVPMERAA